MEVVEYKGKIFKDGHLSCPDNDLLMLLGFWHFCSFAIIFHHFCHSGGEKRPKNLAVDRLHGAISAQVRYAIIL